MQQRILVRVERLNPVLKNVGEIRFTCFNKEDIRWSEISVGPVKDLITELCYQASKAVHENMDVKEGYIIAYAEVPGVVVSEGEGSCSSSDTVLYPKPSRLKKIILYRIEGEMLKPVKEIDLDEEVFVYEGSIDLGDYDAVGLVTDDGLRIILRDEIHLSPVKSATPKTKSRKRRRRKSRKKSRKR